MDEAKAASGAVSPSGDRHPGPIEFQDRVDGRTWKEDPDTLPQTMSWAELEPGRWVAVTRIVTDGVPGRLEIKRFASDGTLLDVTVQRPPPPTSAER
jgi:hypothetical protein